MADSAHHPLPQGAGYGVIVGLGIVFALGLWCHQLTMHVNLHLLMHRQEWFGQPDNSEMSLAKTMNPQKRMSAPTVYRILELTYDSLLLQIETLVLAWSDQQLYPPGHFLLPCWARHT